MGINLYIEKIVAHIPDWLETFKGHFITDYKVSEAKDPNLFLVSGTIESLMKICDIGFLERLLEKLELAVPTTEA